MKYLRLFSNKPTFKEVRFRNTFNVVMADKSEHATAKDSRNGLGKSLLVEIINFCLGANLSETLKKEEMSDWSFSLELEIRNKVFIFKRSVEDEKYVHIEGDIRVLSLEENINNPGRYSIESFKRALGRTILGLDPRNEQKHVPSYRNLISYFMRTDNTAFNNPFTYFAQQPAWSKKIHNAFLLNLDWQLAVNIYNLQDKLKKLDTADKSIEGGILDYSSKSVGELESEKINLEAKLAPRIEELKSFKVHEQYYEIQEHADRITRKIHTLLNRLNLNTQVVNKYLEDLKEENSDKIDIEYIYKEAGLLFSSQLQKRLKDIEGFHEAVISNRKEYLELEVKKLKDKNTEDKRKIQELTATKAEYMQILESHGALEEFSLLQEYVSSQRAQIQEVESKIRRLNEIKDAISELKVEIEQLIQNMRKDYSARRPTLTSMIKMFNKNSEYLYSEPGKLSVDVGKKGYEFKVDIKRSDSAGVKSMKVFCYDLMLAEYWSTVKDQSIPLIHDSKLFDGVDERQVAKAIELAMHKSNEQGWQYICTINSDAVPHDELTQAAQQQFLNSIVLQYHDKDDSGTLLGISF